jgi:hypothetical protein
MMIFYPDKILMKPEPTRVALFTLKIRTKFIKSTLVDMCPKERTLNCDYKIVSSADSVSPNDTGSRSPKEDFFSKPKLGAENFCRVSSKKDSIRSDHKPDPRATQEPATIWYVHQGNIRNRSDSEGTIYDEGNTCYSRSSKSETQKEDEKLVRRRRRKSCTYKHDTFD